MLNNDFYDLYTASVSTESSVSDGVDATVTLHPSFPAGGVVEGLTDNTEAFRSFHLMRKTVNGSVLPVIFCLGIIGNVLNVILLTRRRQGLSALYSKKSYRQRRSEAIGGGATDERGPTTFERSAAIGLLALTSSDLAFCLVGFARVLFVRFPADWRLWMIIGVYYSAYSGALLNLFLFTSTWMITLVSVERYLAVCHPFRAAALIRIRRTIAAHVIIFVVSVAVNVPLFLRNTVATNCGKSTVFAPRPEPSNSSSSPSSSSFAPSNYSSSVNDSNDDYEADCATIYYIASSELSKSQPAVIYTHRIVWFAFGTFIPLILIAYSNVRLSIEVCALTNNAVPCVGGMLPAAGCSRPGSARTPMTRGPSNGSSSTLATNSDRIVTLRLTMTLIAIVVCFIVLVCPSMFVQFAWFTIESVGGIGVPGNNITNVGERRRGLLAMHQIPFQMAILVTDLMQVIKFSSNFLLYCIISRSFRRTFGKLVRIKKCRQRCAALQTGERNSSAPPVEMVAKADNVEMSLMEKQSNNGVASSDVVN